MIRTTLPIHPERCYTWEQWQAGRAERRRIGNLVAPPIIRRREGPDDDRLKATYGGERGPPFNKAFADPGDPAGIQSEGLKLVNTKYVL